MPVGGHFKELLNHAAPLWRNNVYVKLTRPPWMRCTRPSEICVATESPERVALQWIFARLGPWRHRVISKARTSRAVPGNYGEPASFFSRAGGKRIGPKYGGTRLIGVAVNTTVLNCQSQPKTPLPLFNTLQALMCEQE